MAKPPEPKPDKSPFDRFQQLAKKLVAVPKEKAQKPKDDSQVSGS